MQRSRRPMDFSARSAGPCTEMPTPSTSHAGCSSMRSTFAPARLSAVASTMPESPAPTMSTLMRSLDDAQRPRVQRTDLRVLQPREKRKTGDGADEGAEHVGLRVPGIALRAEELVSALPERG